MTNNKNYWKAFRSSMMNHIDDEKHELINMICIAHGYKNQIVYIAIGWFDRDEMKIYSP